MDSLQRFVDADGSAFVALGLMVEGALIIGSLQPTAAFEQHVDAAVESVAVLLDRPDAEALRKVKGHEPAVGMLTLFHARLYVAGRDFTVPNLLVDPAKVSAWWVEPAQPAPEEEYEVPEGLESYDPDEYRPGFGVED